MSVCKQTLPIYLGAAALTGGHESPHFAQNARFLICRNRKTVHVGNPYSRTACAPVAGSDAIALFENLLFHKMDNNIDKFTYPGYDAESGRTRSGGRAYVRVSSHHRPCRHPPFRSEMLDLIRLALRRPTRDATPFGREKDLFS